ncbi:MAG TPA: hypothetical protein VE844_02130 [Gammaproteobacteria bacterium]|nr:hypothetical protein [Gammaproteobacteria bacterium]
MLDDWLERLTREPPEQRARRQLRDVRNATRDTVKELKKHPNDRLTGDILHNHKVRVAEIQRRGIQPPPARCNVCGKRLPKPIGNPWTNNPAFGLLWAILLAVLVPILLPLIGWWALVVFPAGWLLSQTFVWSIPLPFLILLVLSFFL